MIIDYATREDRLGTSLAVKRAQAIAYLRFVRKYIADQDCTWRPTPSKATDVQRTIDQALSRDQLTEVRECVRATR